MFHMPKIHVSPTVIITGIIIAVVTGTVLLTGSVAAQTSQAPSCEYVSYDGI